MAIHKLGGTYNFRDTGGLPLADGGTTACGVLYRSDAISLYSSPAFYIQQNDIIYVEPTQKKANESTATANIFSTPGFWMGLASFAITLVNFLVK